MKREAAFFAQFSTQQLEELLRLGLSQPEGSYDEVLLQIMEVLYLREKKRMEDEIIDKAWSEFQALYNTPGMKGVELYGDSEELDRLLAEEDKLTKEKEAIPEKVVPIRSTGRVRKLFQVARVAVATLVVTFATTVCAQAAGVDFYGMMGTWTKDIFQFQTAGNTPTPEQQKVREEIQTELNAIGVYQDLAPTWWPEGFEVDNLKHDGIEDEFNYVICEYVNKETNQSFFSMVEVCYKSDWFLTEYEKDNTPIEIYQSNGRSFYIMSNIDTVTAVWSDGTIIVTIAGQLTLNEIKGVIDSLGG